MSSLFYLSLPPKNNVIDIIEDDAHHIIKTLRHKVGDALLCQYDNTVYEAEIQLITQGKVTLSVTSFREIPKKETPPLRLYLSLPRPQTLKDLIPTLNELGVDDLFLVITERSFFHSGEKVNLERLIKIAHESSKQCLRHHPINIYSPLYLKDLKLDPHSQKILCYESEQNNHLGDRNIELNAVDIFVGPEGGLSQNEASALEKMGFEICRIAEAILKVPTAIACAVVTCQTLQRKSKK